MFIKICGLSTPETVRAAVRAGADAVGVVLAPGYARTVSPQAAADLLAHVPDHVETVGVFRDQPLDVVLETARAAGVGTVQLHGSEPAADVLAVERAGFGVLRGLAAAQFAALSEEDRGFWAERRILLDAVNPGAGVPFDPALLAAARPTGSWLLAGGLTPDNVAGLVAELAPTGVDVSSGVEVSRGVKSPALIERFIAATRA